ncbi:Major facilitator superfamily domain general substrate transporter [Penicillium taxi]|uniref:Major facilitator superfamily domain general substrate transporter n=1 Tax=Penicillium taxi TaxID=168475 RepID=UPI00254503DF|nr:Major facilitator superfamily domain general substrate transporter [Penicillium taxi]KAJ5908191.1 Major facilitator superfamily domain general substrate transporter [Penicillium taxi]
MVMDRANECSLNDIDETSHLLPQDSPTATSIGRRWFITFALIAGGAMLFDIADSIGSAAETAILEGIICRKYYCTTIIGDIGSEKCKIEPIQTEMAYLNGWRVTFETIHGKSQTSL